MCGIVGIADERQTKAQLTPPIQAMNGAIVHRGPDDHGTFVEHGIALAMRRLSIIDLSGGDQPIWNENRSVMVVFNGEIYNYKELTAALTRRGHTFRSRSDTEVLVHLYEEYGPDCLNHLRGMFAFAIWDLEKRRLFIARDRLGIKPLYYHLYRGCLIFGSEIKSIVRHPDVFASLDLEALNDYLTFKYVPAPRSLFAGIQSLPPGHLMLWQEGHLKIERYWEVAFDRCQIDEGGRQISDHEALEQLSHHLHESVRLRLRSDVAFGAFLSGGVDSSLIVAIMSRLVDEPIKTFSVGYDTAGADDELPSARAVARHCRTEHHEIKIVASDFATLAERVIWHMDQPIADQATVATFMLAESARRHIKVVLTGEGGDEIFAGYARYSGERAARAFSLLPQGAKDALLRVSNNVPGNRRAKLALYALCQREEVARFTNWFPLFNQDAKQAVLSPQLRAQFHRGSSNTVYERLLRETTARTPLHRMLYVDTKHWLPDFLLLRGDKLTMANSVEARVPLLDHELVEFASSLPPKMKLRGRQGKYLLKKLALRYLPASIVYQKKRGFPIPVSQWISGENREFVCDLLTPEILSRRGLFDLQAVERLMTEHQSGFANHSDLIWGLASIEIWHRLFVD